MTELQPWFYVAAACQAAIAGANFFAARVLRYRENLEKVSPMVREVFIVQNVFIVLMVTASAALCVFFPLEISDGRPLGRAICGFLAVFWLLRLVIQFFFYDRNVKREHRAADVFFTACFVFLVGLYGYAAIAA